MSFGKNFAWLGPNDGRFTNQHQQSAVIEGVQSFSGGGGGDMEARVAKLESDVNHITSEISEMRKDVRDIRTKVEDVKDSISSAKIWALLLYIALAGSLLFVMAKGFKWL